MARIEINFPEKVLFKTEIAIRITDLNYGNHLGNDTLLSILHEARVRFFRSLGHEELNVFGCGIIMSDAAIRYLSEGNYGDILQIEIAVDDFSRVGFDIYYRVTCGKTNMALAKTAIVFYDYSNRKIAAVPEAFLAQIKST